MTQIGIPTITNDVPDVPKRLTFEEYRFYQDNTDTRYELHRGRLIPMPTATALHSRICQFLVYCLREYFATTEQNLIVINDVGVRTGIDSSRIPDVVVFPPERWEILCSRKGAGVLDLEETPNLVIEVTSENWRDDYILKRAEYAMISIPEYWIVDPNKKRVRILTEPQLEDGYQTQEFVLGQSIQSKQWGNLQLSVDEMLSPPIVEDLIKAEKAKFRQLQQQVSEERQRAETERQRADRLAALLREQGINPETI
ncbi:Uma2 family endonuclease [Aphanothece sacrum]|uniref:Putative restriction endonuclease domain-containing protein n=1 Tax=Aphanothece sacrum FPU1 TaxID=1920663 RepID=A0A401IL57_APHSA|nr:Uma2 family endonuclease [Aphanothece sacrum]GBF81968.1 hypothetical protein AsFPU1_3391 [Aphanothece sacrum FPU1]GBF83597.1 hypothetical protein AsFPU3_0640 [Aphanothece sacrum FPU3]